jgi:hypothetical protein
VVFRALNVLSSRCSQCPSCWGMADPGGQEPDWVALRSTPPRVQTTPSGSGSGPRRTPEYHGVGAASASKGVALSLFQNPASSNERVRSRCGPGPVAAARPSPPHCPSSRFRACCTRVHWHLFPHRFPSANIADFSTSTADTSFCAALSRRAVGWTVLSPSPDSRLEEVPESGYEGRENARRLLSQAAARRGPIPIPAVRPPIVPSPATSSTRNLNPRFLTVTPSYDVSSNLLDPAPRVDTGSRTTRPRPPTLPCRPKHTRHQAAAAVGAVAAMLGRTAAAGGTESSPTWRWTRRRR